jgi:hypothetical protein
MRHVLVEMASGKHIKPGDRCLTFRGEAIELVSFRVLAPPSTGRVTVRFADGYEAEYYPGVLGCEIQELPDAP